MRFFFSDSEKKYFKSFEVRVFELGPWNFRRGLCFQNLFEIPGGISKLDSMDQIFGLKSSQLSGSEVVKFPSRNQKLGDEVTNFVFTRPFVRTQASQQTFSYARPDLRKNSELNRKFPTRVPEKVHGPTEFAFSRLSTPAVETSTFAYARKTSTKTSVTATEKSQVEKISELLVTPLSTVRRARQIQKIFETRAESSSVRNAITNALAVIWTNSKSLVYLLVASTTVAVGLWLVQSYFGGAPDGWSGLLNILKNLGLKVVPMVLYRALKASGISIGADLSINALLGLAEKNPAIARVLETSLKPEWAAGVLSRLGVDLADYDLTVKNLTRKAVSNAVSGGFALATGNVSSYLTSTVVGAGIKVGATAATSGVSAAVGGVKGVFSRDDTGRVEVRPTPRRKPSETKVRPAEVQLEKTVEIFDQVKQDTVDEIFGTTVATDTLKMAEKIHSTKVEPARAALAPSVRVPKNADTETSTSVKDMITENKAMIFGTATAVGLLTLAFTTGSLDTLTEIFTDRLSGISSSNVADLGLSALASTGNFLKESAIARSSLFGLISNQIGLQTLVDGLVDRITPEEFLKMKKLESKIRNGGPKAATRTQKFFALLIGDRIYSEKELSGLSVASLKKIAASKNLKVPREIDAAALRKGILTEQTSRLNNISVLIATVVSKTVKTSITSAALEYGYRELAARGEIFGTTLEKEKIQTELIEAKIDARSQTELSSQEKETVAPTSVNEIYDESGPETLVEFEKRVDAEWSRKMEEAQTTLDAEKRVGRAFRKFTRENEEATSREWLVEKKRLEAIEKIEARAKTEATYVRRQAARRLKDAALLDSLTEKIGVVISNPITGESTAIPTDNLLLDPKLQDALKEVEFTPLMEYLAKQAAKSSLGWIPGVGWVASAINSVNWGLDVAEKIKDAYKITNVVLELRSETGESGIDVGTKNIETLDGLLKKRVPTLASAVDDLLTLEKVNLKVTVLEVLRDRYLFGWSDRQVAIEIGKRVLAGKELSALADATVEKVGGMIWSAMGK